LEDALRMEGYNVALAANGQEGIRQSVWHRFDLLLLDPDLPDIDGWAVFRMLTSINPFVQSIVIFGQCHQSDPRISERAGALIENPLDVPKLLETMGKLLKNSREVNRLRMICHRANMRCQRREGPQIGAEK